MECKPIGTIHTPYSLQAPFRPEPDAEGEFYIEVEEELIAALDGLEQFSHLIVLYHFHENEKTHLKAHPPGKGIEVGTFASRSPNRPNKLGMNVAGIIKIVGNRIYTSPLDALDGSPLIDLKPYITELDCRPEASNGWLGRK